MKKEYNSLEIQLFFLDSNDVVRTSDPDLTADDDFTD